MASNLFRRGGIWWARLVVPARLRVALNRREFIQSCRTHEKSIAKLVAAVLLAGWRRQLLQVECRPMTADVLKLVDGAPGLAAGGALPLAEAASLAGISQRQLLRAAVDGALKLFCRVSHVAGHIVHLDHLEPISPEAGRAGGVVVPQPQDMPASASETSRFGLLPLCDSADVAGAVLADGLVTVVIVALAVPGQAGVIFAPDMPITVNVGELEVLAVEVDALRMVMKSKVSQDAIDHARALQTAAMRGQSVSAGKKAHKRFSEAVEAYTKEPTGLPQDLVSASEQGQRKKGLMLFAEFMGDLPLVEIDADKLRAFRDGPLKMLPAKANNLPKALRRDTMTATVEAIRAAGVEWPLMSRAMQHERVLWLCRLFAWLQSKEWLTNDPAASLRGETGLTKVERKAVRRELDPNGEGRGPFNEAELRVIFSVPHYQTGRGDHVVGNERWYPFEYWLPVLGAYAGLRIKEASQLYLADVRQVDGLWVLDINENTEDKSLKNQFSRRLMPLHPKLVELGFLDYCDRLRAAGFRRVFPELTYSKSDARYGKEPGRKMSAMLKKLGMPRDNFHVFHCTRHNANNGLIRVPLAILPFAGEGLKKYIRYVVLGHKPGDDVNVRHYTRTTIQEKAALVNGLAYNLHEIAKFDIEFGLGQVHAALANKNGARRGREDMGPLNPA